MLLGAPFDVVVCNPPYLPDTTWDRAAWGGTGALNGASLCVPEVALFAGLGGTTGYKAVAVGLRDESATLLSPAAQLVLEVDSGHTTVVCDILAAAGWEIVSTLLDAQGLQRCSVMQRAV